MKQITAQDALERLDLLIGTWAMEATPPGGEPWPGESRSTIEWHDSRGHVIQRSTNETPQAPNAIPMMGCDAANDTYFQLYSDDRGVCRVYEMRIGDGEWRLWSTGAPFAQRFSAPSTTATRSSAAGRQQPTARTTRSTST